MNARREVIFMRIKASKLLAAVLALCLTLGTAPAASAAANPTATRSSEPPAACQNRASPASRPSVRAT